MRSGGDELVTSRSMTEANQTRIGSKTQKNSKPRSRLQMLQRPCLNATWISRQIEGESIENENLIGMGYSTIARRWRSILLLLRHERTSHTLSGQAFTTLINLSLEGMAKIQFPSLLPNRILCIDNVRARIG